MIQNSSYKLPPIQLSEKILFLNDGILGKTVQLCRAGKYIVDKEEVEITKEDLGTMVKNFDENVRGIDIALDFSHESEGKAAAWINRLYVENEIELWSEVEWTNPGASAVKQREFRYVSADFQFNYKNNETNLDYGPTLLGAGLTNRPVVKRMVPVILSENNNNSKKEMEMKTVEQMQKELDEANAKIAAKDLELSASKKVETDLKLSEEKAKNDLKLSEEKTKTEKAEQEKAKVFAEKKSTFDAKLSEGTVCEAQREDFMNDNMAGFISKAVPFQTKTNGNDTDGKKVLDANSKTPAQDKVMELAEKISKEEKVSLSEGIKKVLHKEKKLNEDYLKETAV